jgi:hypothetical protein
MASSGNFCTMNQLDPGAYATITEGNLKVGGAGSSTADQAKRGATFYIQSGKWYWEVRQTVGGSSYGSVGISVGSAGTATPTANSGFSQGLMYQSIAGTLEAVAAGYVGLGTVTTTSTGVSSVSNNQVINIALDMDNRKLWFGKDGTYFNSGDPASGSNPQFSWTTDTFVTPTSRNYATNRPSHYNFGQDSTFGGNETAGGNADGNSHGDFHSSVPTGFLALCSSNLPISSDIDPAQTDSDYPSKQFNTVIYTGTGSTRSVSNLNFQPDLLWLKCRSIGQSARLIDSSRGVSKTLTPADTQNEQTESNGITSFDSDGFTIGSSTGGFNTSSATYVAWAWRANGGTTATNSEGNHDCTLQANAKAGFSIMTLANYTSASGVTIGHGLDTAPSFYIHKPLGNSKPWHVYHSGIGATKALVLNTDAAEATAIGYFANTEPTADVLSLGNTFAGTGNGIVYAWSEIEGYSKFGTYEGNANANGPFIYTGFRPRMVFIKNSDGQSPWLVWDTVRNTFNPANKGLAWNDDAAESDYTGYPADILSNGFKLRSSNATINASATWIYGAWGDVPFKYNNTF